jgi:hypothetical protein
MKKEKEDEMKMGSGKTGGVVGVWTVRCGGGGVVCGGRRSLKLIGLTPVHRVVTQRGRGSKVSPRPREQRGP